MPRKKIIKIGPSFCDEEWRRWVKRLLDSAKKEVIIIVGE